MRRIFTIFRYDPTKDGQPYFQDFPFETEEKKTVLEALMEIRNEQDESLAFRYSCREAVCGSCGMILNGQPELACRTMVDSFGGSRIVIEPLPNLEIQKDLIVDMGPFWEALERLKPYLVPDENHPAKEFPVEERQMAKIEPYLNCILCACCYAACPVVARDGRYMGPIALTKLFRFAQDPRDRRHFSDLAKADTPDGLWSCDLMFRCNLACPKDVRPAHGIEDLRRKLIIEKTKRIFKRKP
jgi:succinate dehydrogenase / fumarate reductase iron-sulfur subunit